MRDYPPNAKWLMYLAPFGNLSISAAYITPFFLANGLSLTQIMLLQTIYSVACVLWEIPSGLIADQYGRAFSIKLSVVIVAVGEIFYGFGSHFWQFALCEFVLAIGNGLSSGINTALLIDSLRAEGKEKLFVKISQRINGFAWIATAVAVPLAMLLVHFISVRSTIIADGLLTGIGAFFAFKLTEAPRYEGSEEELRLTVWHTMKRLAGNSEVRWLVVLGSVLSAATYLGFWFTAPYYTRLGVPVVWFGAILAARSVWKAWLSHRFSQEHHIERNMVTYALLAGLVFVGMASGTIWLVWVVLGHDIVQALQSQPITDRLNTHIAHRYRATMNSVINLFERLLYSAAGPLVGLLADREGLGIAFVVMGIAGGIIALTAVARLHRFKTFQEGR